MANTVFLAPGNFGPVGSQFFSSAGLPLANGNVYQYAAGTTTPTATYTDATGTVANPNPISLSPYGRLPNDIRFNQAQLMKLVITDSTNTAIATCDNLKGIDDISGEIFSVSVINSVFSSDTSNAASANAASWAWGEGANAYSQANAAYSQANAAYAEANVGISFYSNNSLIHEGSELNFNNTAVANIAVSTAGGLTNVSIVANGSTSNVVSNGWATTVGVTFQFGQFDCTNGSTSVSFGETFPNAILGVFVQWAYTAPDAGYVSSQSTSGFTYVNGNAGLCYYLAVGH